MNLARSGRVRLLTTITATVIAAAGLTACGSASAGSGGEETTIRYQTGAGQVDPLQLADALGYLDGVKLKKVGDVTGGPQSLQALASNQIDIGASAFFGAIAQTVATGVPIKAVVPTYGSNGDVYSAVIASQTSGVDSARDLIGKKIAVNTLGANAEAVLDTWFDKEGLTKKEQDKITLVVLPPLNTPEALEKGQVDAAYLNATGITNTKKVVAVKELVKDVDVVGPYSGGGFSLREDFIEKNPTTSKTVVTGVAKAVNFIETHEKQEIYDVYFPWLEKHGYGDYEEAIEANFPGSLGVPSAEPKITDEDIALWLDWLEGRGDVDADAIKPSDVYTNEFNPYA